MGEGFFAPVESDLVDSLLGRYQHTRAIIGEIAGAVTSNENTPAVAHFISGNLSGRRGGYGFSVGEVFNVTGAVASLNAAYWQEALTLSPCSKSCLVIAKPRPLLITTPYQWQGRGLSETDGYLHSLDYPFAFYLTAYLHFTWSSPTKKAVKILPD